MGTIKKRDKDLFTLSHEEDEFSDAGSNFSKHETNSEFSSSSENLEEGICYQNLNISSHENTTQETIQDEKKDLREFLQKRKL